MIRRPLRPSLSALVCAFAVGLAAHAEALLKPLPKPSLAGVDKARAKELEDARAAFEEAKPRLFDKNLAEAYAQIAGVYASRGFPEIAEIALYDAAQLTPYDGRWPYLRGVLALSRKQRPQARSFFEHALELDRFYLPIRAALVTQLIEEGDLERARQLVDEYLAKDQDQPKAHALAGEIALRQKRPADAAKAFERALELDPKANRLYAPLAEAYQALGKPAEAATARSRAGDVPPRLADPLALGLLQSPDGTPAPGDFDKQAANADSLAQAAFLFSVGQIDAARAQLDTALRARPDDPAILALYARLEAAAGRTEVARERAQAALRAAPRSALAMLTQGLVLETGADDDAARGWYEKAVNADPALAEARLLLGDQLMRRKRYAEAAEQYRQLYRIKPEDVGHLAQLVAAETLGGHCAEAMKDVEAALRERPKHGQIAQLYVRTASTCRSASADDRQRAAELGNRLYAQFPTAANTEALALAAAAAGKFEDAVQLQGAAVFEAVKGGNPSEIALYKSFFKRFEAHQVPDLPWPAEHPLFQPPRAAPMAGSVPVEK